MQVTKFQIWNIWKIQNMKIVQCRLLMMVPIENWRSRLFLNFKRTFLLLFLGQDKIVQFSQWTVRKHGTDDIRTVCTKQILIDETLTVRINVMGRRLKPDEFGFESNVALNVEDIENIIKIVDNSRICSGCAEISASENIVTLFTCRDKEGYLRHTFCPLLLPKENGRANKCKFCARAKHTLNQKMVRIKKSKKVTKKYMQVTNLSPQRRQKILRLQNKLKSEARDKIRAQNKVNVLKNVVKSCRQNIPKIETENLHKILDNQKRLSRNDKIAITEMFAAASKKNPVSRKYSDDWVVLCMLIHM